MQSVISAAGVMWSGRVRAPPYGRLVAGEPGA